MRYTESGLIITLDELRKMLEYAENRAKYGDMRAQITIEPGKKPRIIQEGIYGECNGINHTYLAH